MAKKSKHKQSKKASPKSKSREQKESFWEARKPILLFTLGFVGFMILFYLLSFTDFYANYIFDPVSKVNANLASWILNIFGQETSAVGNNVKNSDFSIDIKEGCDALEATAIFAACVTFYPSKLKYKLRAYLLGVTFLLGANLIRVISLFLVGIYFPKAFDTMHLDVWQAIFIILAVLSFVFWVNWQRKRRE